MDAEAAALPPRSKGVFAWMLVSQLVTLLSGVPWVVLLGLTLVVLDQARDDWRSWALLAGVAVYAPLVLVSFAKSWTAWLRHRNGPAAVWTTVPVPIALALLGYLVWAAGLGIGIEG